MNIVAIMKSDESASSLRQAMNAAKSADIDIYVTDDSDITKQKAVMNGHDVLFVDIESSNEQATDHLSHFIKKYHLTRPVIVTASNPKCDDIRRLMDLGVVDVLTHPIRETDLLIALDHAARSQKNSSSGSSRRGSGSSRRGKVISFLKGGGGAGVTTLATQGGGLLAAGDKKEKPKVCLLDLDIQFGAAGLYLDLESSVGLVDLLDVPERMDHSLLESAMARHATGLDVLTAPKDILPLETVTPEFVTMLLGFARDSYDYVMLDLPQSWTLWSYTALSRCDLIVMVSQLSVASVRQTVHQMKTLCEQDLEQIPVKHVLNRHRRGGFVCSAEQKDAEKALGRKFDYQIANNYELVGEAINRGVMLTKVQRRSKTEKDLRKMMMNFTKILNEAEMSTVVQASR